MKRVHTIVIGAPLNKVFAAAADLARWPEFLPHYRYNRFLSQTPAGGIVKMSCVRSGLALDWISKFRIDPEKRQLHFHHQVAQHTTKGIEVLWDFEKLSASSVRVTITYDIEPKIPVLGRAVADWIAGRFFIDYVAEKTLAGLKRKIEAQSAAKAALAIAAAPAAKPIRSRRAPKRALAVK